jgi:uncharacterized protein (DUF1697 family)
MKPARDLARYVVFLRAINVTGRFVKMAELASHVQSLGLQGVQTFINSGNVVFSAPHGVSSQALTEQLQAGLHTRLGFFSEAFVRSAAQVQALAQRTAALASHVPPEGDLNVIFLPADLSDAQAQAVRDLSTAIDRFDTQGPELLWLCHQRQSESTFSNAVLERRLKLRCTLRRATMLQRLSAQLLNTSSA